MGSGAEEEYKDQMAQMHAWYCKWQERLGGACEKSNEDARFVLPNAAETKMTMTMNVRELMHFFTVRCCNRAQWEIREVAWRMLEEVLKVAPELFVTAGPSCVRGGCSEGKMTCAKPDEVRARRRALTEKIAEKK